MEKANEKQPNYLNGRIATKPGFLYDYCVSELVRISFASLGMIYPSRNSSRFSPLSPSPIVSCDEQGNYAYPFLWFTHSVLPSQRISRLMGFSRAWRLLLQKDLACKICHSPDTPRVGSALLANIWLEYFHHNAATSKPSLKGCLRWKYIPRISGSILCIYYSRIKVSVEPERGTGARNRSIQWDYKYIPW